MLHFSDPGAEEQNDTMEAKIHNQLSNWEV